MIEEETLSKIYTYLELDNVTDYRLRLKAELMQKIIRLTSQWKEGYQNEWIDKLATRSSLSTRKVRENYIEPLITEGILEKNGKGQIKFVGLPDNAVMPCELTEQELTEELQEENENRNKLGKTPVSLEEWKKTRSKRKKPLG